MPIEDGDLAPLTLLLSPERLAPLTELTGNVRAAIELHQETLRMGTALMNVIATVEIALRNAACDNLARHFDTPGWLFAPPLFQWREPERSKISLALDSARRAEYSKLTQAEKHGLDEDAFPNGPPAQLSHLGRARARRQQIAVSDGKVIAELSFYIWKRLYGPDYEHSLWRTTLKRTFPYKKISRSQVADALEVLYQTRNRLAHHEAVLQRRFESAVSAIRFVVSHLHAALPSCETPLSHLVEEDLARVVDQATLLHSRMNLYRTT